MPTIFRYKPFRRRLAPVITIGIKVEATLLGRESIFDRFKICFLESRGVLTFESAELGSEQV